MKDKILNIVIISLVALLIINYFSAKDRQEKEEAGALGVTLSAKSYSIPAKVELVFQNNSQAPATVAPCRDIKLNRNGEYVPLDKNCDELSIPAQTTVHLNYDSQYQYFLDKGSYVFEVETGDKKFLLPFDIGYRGSIAKLFIGVFYAPIYNLMVFLIEFFNNSLGWAIIAITIIVRIVLLWPQHRMMVSQKKLQAVQPKIKDLQEKHKGDSQTLGVELMALYKKEKVNPMGSCGLLIIQLPILLVIYNVIISVSDVSNSYYLYSFLGNFKVSDISMDFYGVDLLSVGGLTGAILGVAVGLVQYIQVKLSLDSMEKTKTKGLVLEKKPGDAGYNPLMPDPEFMNKFMLYGMPAMVVVFTYSLFVGVGIYWGVSTLFAIFQQLFVNKILKK